MVVEEDSLSIGLLEEKHLITILVHIAVNGPTRKIELYQSISTNPRMPIKIDKLEMMGLVSQHMDEYTRSTIVSLTPEGKEIAQHLIAVDNILRTIQ